MSIQLVEDDFAQTANDGECLHDECPVNCPLWPHYLAYMEAIGAGDKGPGGGFNHDVISGSPASDRSQFMKKNNSI